MGVEVPYSVFNIGLNLIPIIIGLKFVGVKFTLSSCCVVFLSSFLTDLIPVQPITYDTLLVSIFGGLINGAAISLCLIGNTSSGGTDIIAIYFSEKSGKDIWNIILAANALMLVIAGILFGWDRALYSIIFQFTSTQTVQMLHQRYKNIRCLSSPKAQRSISGNFPPYPALRHRISRRGLLHQRYHASALLRGIPGRSQAPGKKVHEIDLRLLSTLSRPTISTDVFITKRIINFLKRGFTGV